MANKLGLEAVVASTICGYMYMCACKICVLLSAAPETTEKPHLFSTAKREHAYFHRHEVAVFEEIAENALSPRRVIPFRPA